MGGFTPEKLGPFLKNYRQECLSYRKHLRGNTRKLGSLSGYITHVLFLKLNIEVGKEQILPDEQNLVHLVRVGCSPVAVKYKPRI